MTSGNWREEKHFRAQEHSILSFLSDDKPQTHLKTSQGSSRYSHLHLEGKVMCWLASSGELVEPPWLPTWGPLQRSSWQNSHSSSALGPLAHWSFLARWSLQSARCDLLSAASRPSKGKWNGKKCFQPIHKVSVPSQSWNCVGPCSWPWEPMWENGRKSDNHGNILINSRTLCTVTCWFLPLFCSFRRKQAATMFYNLTDCCVLCFTEYSSSDRS